MKKDLLTLLDLEPSEILSLIRRGIELKKLGRKAPRSLTGYRTIRAHFCPASGTIDSA